LIKTVEDLPTKVKDYVKYCVNTYSLVDIVNITMNGLDREACVQWDITPEQWQDGLIAAIFELRSLQQKRTIHLKRDG
jgi:hypothetical protein